MRFALLSAVAVLLGGHSATAAQLNGKVLAQYWPTYASWSQSPAQFPWSGTSIAYYFAIATSASGLDTTNDVNVMPTFVSQAQAHGVKAVVSLGGWTGSGYFSTHVASSASRATFVQQIVTLINTYKFDGVDIDWEYPNSAGAGTNAFNSQDSANYLLFLQSLRAALGTQPLITAAVAMTGFNDASGSPLTNVGQYAKYLDYINLMNYDVTGSWTPKTGPESPLYRCQSDTSVVDAVSFWTNSGFPAGQILMGMPSYAISFTTASSTLASSTAFGQNGAQYQTSLYQSKVATSSSNLCGGSYGYCTYKAIIAAGILSADGKTAQNGFTRTWDGCTHTPFVFNSNTREMIAYDDSQSVKDKVAYAYNLNLGGVMVFDSLGYDASIYSVIARGLQGGQQAPPPATSTSTTASSTSTSASMSIVSSASSSASMSVISSASSSATSSSSSSTPSSSSTSSSSSILFASSTTSSTPSPSPAPAAVTTNVRCASSSTYQMCLSTGRCSGTANVPGGTNCINNQILFSNTAMIVRSVKPTVCQGSLNWKLASSRNTYSSIGGVPSGIICSNSQLVFK